MEDFNSNFGFGFVNTDPTQQNDEVILINFIVDVSGSMYSNKVELDNLINSFTDQLKSSHSAGKILVSHVLFNDQIVERQGFQNIENRLAINTNPSGTTALFKAALESLKNTLAYKKGLAGAGTDAITVTFIITDGDDTDSSISEISELQALAAKEFDDEGNVRSQIILCGIGTNPSLFQKAAATIDKRVAVTVEKQIKPLITALSKSVTASTSGQTVVF
jgi:uncharacterized protein YegL